MTNYLNFQIAVLINQKVILDEQVGVKDYGLLDSALARPQHSLFGKDAALLISLSQNHSFHNANKPTALMCTAMFFRLNESKLCFIKDSQEEDFVVDVVKHRYTLDEVAHILEVHTAPII